MTTVSAHTRVRNGKPEHVSTHQRDQRTGTAPKHAGAAGRVSLGAAGLLAAVGVLEVMVSVTNLLVAVLTVLTMSVLAWGGVNRRKARRVRRRAVRRVAPNSWSRSRSPAQWQALTDRKERLRRQRWERRDEVWTRRRAAAADWWSRTRKGGTP
jgi:hypothetical protein